MISKPYFGVMNRPLSANETFGRNNSKPPLGAVKVMLDSHMRLNGLSSGHLRRKGAPLGRQQSVSACGLAS